MRLLDRVMDRLGVGGPLTRADRRLWAQARTLLQLQQLMAAWLTGEIQSWPGYYGPCDVDEAESPGLTETLRQLNRVGLLTVQSQVGFDGPGADGAHWEQYAAVQGFCDSATLDWLLGLDLPQHRIGVWPHLAGTKACRSCGGVTVTTRDGSAHTSFGRYMSSRVIGGELFVGCHPDAIVAVCGAHQVTLYACEPGDNRMWSVLRRAAESRLAGVR